MINTNVLSLIQQTIKAMRIYRGANEGIEKQAAGSFYTTDFDLANEYAQMENSPKIYAYNVKLNLIDIKETENGSEDCGINAMTDEELSLYEGYIAKNGIQICLFGRISNNCNENSSNDFKAAIFEKLSVEELRSDANANFRRYDR